MKITITSGVPKEKKEEIINAFKSSLVIRERLIEILNKKIEVSREQTCKTMSYENSNWALVQADKIGYERGLRELILLLE